MFRKFSVYGIAFVALISIAGAGCGGSPEQLDPGETDDVADSKEDGTLPLRMGTYDVDLGLYYSMTLELNNHYTMIGGCRPGPTGPHCFAISEDQGHYRLTRSGSTKYIRFYSDLTGEQTFRFSYKVSGSQSQTVKLTETHTDKAYTASLQEASKSQEGESCGGFVASVHGCASGLSCKASARCCDIPGVCVRQ